MTSRARCGLALIVVVGILGVLAVLAVAFVAMAQLERRASEQRVNAARAYLLARSGIEDALARLELGQDPAYGGENWDGSPDGLLSGFEADQEVYHRTGEGTPADLSSCPVRHAMRPSFFARARPMPNPRTELVDGRRRGYSGALAGDYAAKGNTYALKVSSSNAGIYINGGALDAQDRDPDGPGAKPEDFQLNRGAAAEVAPLLPNGIPDHRDVSMEGPNGFLVRLLNNLDAVATNGATSNLGVEIVGHRPLGGYKALDELKPILSQPFVQNPSLVQQVQNLITPPAGMTRYEKYKSYLTLHAWVDPKVVKPQPMDGRPQRWEDMDDAHRNATEAQEVSGVHEDFAVATFSGSAYSAGQVLSGGQRSLSGRVLSLERGGSRQGESWTQYVTTTNYPESHDKGPRTYPVTWERNFVYAWSQLRCAQPAFEPRAPVSLNAASREVLASAFLGLKGAYLEVWEGSAGWEGGFGWYTTPVPFGSSTLSTYPYPDQATEETPWIRTRVDYGMTYGNSPFASSSRPWYGPRSYNPHALPYSPGFPPYPPGSREYTGGGKPLVLSAPLGRLRETLAISPDQAQAIAQQAQGRIAESGSFRTWEQFDTFVSLLPHWEDLDDDGHLDGVPYVVDAGPGSSYAAGVFDEKVTADTGAGTYVRRMYKREDLNSDGLMTREIFTPGPAAGSWALGVLVWPDPHVDRATLKGQGLVPGLTFLQKDVLRASANPNTDLNDFNPDQNLFKEVDKTDLGGIQADPASCVHTTELALDDTAGYAKVQAVGRVTARNGRLLALRQVGAILALGKVYQDTTQADFMKAYHAVDPATLRAEEEAEGREREELARAQAERARVQTERMAQGRAEYKAQREAYYKSQGEGTSEGQNAEYYAESDARRWENNYWAPLNRQNHEEDRKIGEAMAQRRSERERLALAETFWAPPASYPLSQPLVSYPEPQRVGRGRRAASAPYDGQLSLGFVGFLPRPEGGPQDAMETLRGGLFNSVDAEASGDLAVADIRGPLREPLLASAGGTTGDLFPDGTYSEKDRTLRYPIVDSLSDSYLGNNGDRVFYIACWVKPGWFPEASPRAHSLASFSPAERPKRWGFISGSVPLDDIWVRPAGLYFVPARNNISQDAMAVYLHNGGTWAASAGGYLVDATKGASWPCHALIWGTVHNFYGSDNLNRRGTEVPLLTHPVGRLEAHRWQHVAMVGDYSRHTLLTPGTNTSLIVGRQPADVTGKGGGWNFISFNLAGNVCARAHEPDGSPHHLRFGEMASEHNMNYVADATFAHVRAGRERVLSGAPAQSIPFFTGAAGPAALGRYYKEGGNYIGDRGATYTSPKLPPGLSPRRITWTEIPCDLWFDQSGDGWLGDPPAGAGSGADVQWGVGSVTTSARGEGLGPSPVPSTGNALVDQKLRPASNLYNAMNDNVRWSQGILQETSVSVTPNASAFVDPRAYQPKNDQFGPGGSPGPNGLRDVHIALEIWDDRSTESKTDDLRLARFDDPAADNRIPQPQGRLTYKAVFVNEWDAATRANHPLDVTPFLDDVTIVYQEAGGPKVVAYEIGQED